MMLIQTPIYCVIRWTSQSAHLRQSWLLDSVHDSWNRDQTCANHSPTVCSCVGSLSSIHTRPCWQLLRFPELVLPLHGREQTAGPTPLWHKSSVLNKCCLNIWRISDRIESLWVCSRVKCASLICSLNSYKKYRVDTDVYNSTSDVHFSLDIKLFQLQYLERQSLI